MPIEPVQDSHLPVIVRVFASENTAGTTAAVRFYSTDPGEPLMADLARHDCAEASCFAWGAGENLRVRCYKNDYPIQFCGHGLLSTAAAARHRGWQSGSLISSPSGVRYGIITDEEGRVALSCPRIYCRPAASEPCRWFGEPAAAAATALGDDGYWVLRWPDGFDLRALKPDLRTMARETTRAVIATAAQGAGECVAMRYFAPQYGTDEDAVTGSAAVVLADFWDRPQLQVHQCSAAGGHLHLTLGSERVVLGGCIEVNIAAAATCADSPAALESAGEYYNDVH